MAKTSNLILAKEYSINAEDIKNLFWKTYKDLLKSRPILFNPLVGSFFMSFVINFVFLRLFFSTDSKWLPLIASFLMGGLFLNAYFHAKYRHKMQSNLGKKCSFELYDDQIIIFDHGVENKITIHKNQLKSLHIYVYDILITNHLGQVVMIPKRVFSESELSLLRKYRKV